MKNISNLIPVMYTPVAFLLPMVLTLLAISCVILHRRYKQFITLLLATSSSLLLALFAANFLLGRLAARGSYTSSYDPVVFFTMLTDIGMIYVGLLLTLAASIFFYRAKKNEA